jgi:hypothetical protein
VSEPDRIADALARIEGQLLAIRRAQQTHTSITDPEMYAAAAERRQALAQLRRQVWREIMKPLDDIDRGRMRTFDAARKAGRVHKIGRPAVGKTRKLPRLGQTRKGNGRFGGRQLVEHV